MGMNKTCAFRGCHNPVFYGGKNYCSIHKSGMIDCPTGCGRRIRPNLKSGVCVFCRGDGRKAGHVTWIQHEAPTPCRKRGCLLLDGHTGACMNRLHGDKYTYLWGVVRLLSGAEASASEVRFPEVDGLQGPVGVATIPSIGRVLVGDIVFAGMLPSRDATSVVEFVELRRAHGD